MSSTDIENIVQHIHPALTVSETEAVRQKLEGYINDLIQKNFERLVQILYRIDVSEKKIKQLLQSHPQTDAAVIISGLIIERQLEKMRMRERFKKDDNISEADKW